MTLKEEDRTEIEIEIAKHLLAEGSEPAFIAKITSLSLDKIQILQKQ